MSVMKQLNNYRMWIKGIVAATIGGAANAVTVIIVDPVAFNLQEGLDKVATVAVVSAVFSVALYLQKSPLPEDPK